MFNDSTLGLKPLARPPGLTPDAPLVTFYRSGTDKKFRWRCLPRRPGFDRTVEVCLDIRNAGGYPLTVTEETWEELGLPSTWDANEYKGRTVQTHTYYKH